MSVEHKAGSAEKIGRLSAWQALQAKRAQPPLGDDLLQQFSERLEAQVGTVQKIASLEDVPRYITEHLLQDEGRTAELALGSDPLLSDIPWSMHGDFKLVAADAIRHGGIAVSAAAAAVAETGSLVLCSGPDNPTLLNFLPDHHVVLVREEDVVASLEDMWALLRQRYPGGLPRAINLVTGPSSTGDVALTFAFGVHGPLSVHALVLGS